MTNDLQSALDAINGKLHSVQTFCDYYDGAHKLTFASEKYQSTFARILFGMRDNLCPIVVDAPVDRMEVVNFSGDESEKAVADEAWKLWQRESLELVSSDVHKSALKTGYGYLIVWADETGQARLYAQDPRQCAVIEDEETGRALFAAKQWMTLDKKVRVNLYYANRIEKYQSQKSYNGQEHTALKADGFTQDEADAPNPYGIVPMFQFKTQPVLPDAIPVQDLLNKTICDRLVAQEFGAFPQRWAVGLEPPKNELTGNPELPFTAGIDRLWFTSDKDTKFGEFSAADIKAYLEAADADRMSMARVTGTPLHFFGLSSNDVPSGEALKTLESRFTKKVKRLALNFGTVWAEVMKFALVIEGKPVSPNLTVQWHSPEQRSEKEFLETLLQKQKLGVPNVTLWEEAGYTEEDIAKFQQLNGAAPPTDPIQHAEAAA
jgi:hypothetical protein